MPRRATGEKQDLEDEDEPRRSGEGDGGLERGELVEEVCRYRRQL